MLPKFTLEKLKFAVDPPTFTKAVALYEQNKVTKFEEGLGSYAAIVQGTKPYRVSMEARDFRLASCTCYLGQTDVICKHMVAVALRVVMNGQPLQSEDKEQITRPTCSGKLGELTLSELKATRKSLSGALRYIKSYNGPSRIWFTYQDSLEEGCNRLSAIISELPVSKQTTELLVKLLLRLDHQLSHGGVDDSNGTVGGFIEEAVVILLQFSKLDPKCRKAFEVLKSEETSFGWETPLLKRGGS